MEVWFPIAVIVEDWLLGGSSFNYFIGSLAFDMSVDSCLLFV